MNTAVERHSLGRIASSEETGTPPLRAGALTEARRTLPGLPDTVPHGLPALVTPPTRTRTLTFVLLALIAIFWGGLGTWAVLARIEGAVVAQGSFSVENGVPVVQHLEGGLLRSVNVREGSHVHAGQMVMAMSTAAVDAQDRILTNQLVNALAQDLRLTTEYRSGDKMVLTDELRSLLALDASFAALVQTQRELFAADNEMWRGQAAILNERINQLTRQIEGFDARADTLERRLTIVRDELRDYKDLFAKGLVTRSEYNNRRESELTLMASLSDVQSQREAVQQRISETRERILQQRRQRVTDISTRQQQVKAQIFDTRQRILANDDIRERSLIRAPVAGRVLDLKFAKAGEVVRAGEEIMKIVPDNAATVIEGKVRPRDIDQVHLGSPARVRLTAYNFRTTPPVNGEVIHVSADRFQDERRGQFYYLVKVRVPASELASLPGVEVLPGMPAQIMIATGEHSVADYILGPILSGFSTALREKL